MAEKIETKNHTGLTVVTVLICPQTRISTYINVVRGSVSCGLPLCCFLYSHTLHFFVLTPVYLHWPSSIQDSILRDGMKRLEQNGSKLREERQMKRFAFILICLVFAGPLKAEEKALKGNDLYTACTGTSNEQAECRMWIIGFFNGLGLAQIAARHNGLPLTCYPDDLTNERATLIVEKYMRDHPEMLRLSAITIAAAALTLAYPCSGH